MERVEAAVSVQEAEVRRLEGRVEELLLGGEVEEDLPEDLAKLRADNAKLRYRVNILQRAVQREAATA